MLGERIEWAFEISQPFPRDIPTLIRLYLLIHHKQLHSALREKVWIPSTKLGTKYSNIEPMAAIPIQTTTQRGILKHSIDLQPPPLSQTSDSNPSTPSEGWLLPLALQVLRKMSCPSICRVRALTSHRLIFQLLMGDSIFRFLHPITQRGHFKAPAEDL